MFCTSVLMHLCTKNYVNWNSDVLNYTCPLSVWYGWGNWIEFFICHNLDCLKQIVHAIPTEFTICNFCIRAIDHFLNFLKFDAKFENVRLPLNLQIWKAFVSNRLKYFVTLSFQASKIPFIHKILFTLLFYEYERTKGRLKSHPYIRSRQTWKRHDTRDSRSTFPEHDPYPRLSAS